MLKDIRLPGVEIEIEIAKEYRFAMVLRGAGLHGAIADTDPQQTGVAPLPARALDPAAEKTAELVNQWLAEARARLKGHEPANMARLRGFAMEPGCPSTPMYKLKAACVAVYLMYKGVRDWGHGGHPDVRPRHHCRRVRACGPIWDDYDFVFCHIKYTDSRGEDGDFDAKVKVIEGVDEALPRLLS